jgi:hypothetical protein
MKKKFNYEVNEKNYITYFTDLPFSTEKQYIELTDEEVAKIEIGLTRIIKGKIDNSLKSNFLIEREKLQKINNFRSFRENLLKKYDLLRINVQNGDIDPKTNLPYEPVSQEEKQWRLTVLNFTDLITKDTEEEDYPETPERLK